MTGAHFHRARPVDPDVAERRYPDQLSLPSNHSAIFILALSTSLFQSIATGRLAAAAVAATLQLELVGNLGCDVLESDGGAGDPLEANAVEREPGQLAHLDLPLDEGLGLRIAVHAQEQEALSLLVVAVVSVQDLE